MSSLDAARANGPFVVAHRAGNDLRSLRRAEAAGVAVIEADLHLFANRVEVRHLKTMGPVPLLWDRWKLAPGWAPRLLLDRLLDAAAPTTTLMLDLKGRDSRLAARVVAALRDRRQDQIVCCSQNWELLSAIEDGADVGVVHSVGGRRQLAALHQLATGRSIAGASVHKKLLDRRRVAELRRHTGVVMVWPVLDAREAARLVDWGVDGLITQRFEAVAAGLQARPAGEAV